MCLIADYLSILLVAHRNHIFHLDKLALQVSSLGVLSQGIGSHVIREGGQLGYVVHCCQVSSMDLRMLDGTLAEGS